MPILSFVPKMVMKSLNGEDLSLRILSLVHLGSWDLRMPNLDVAYCEQKLVLCVHGIFQ